MEDSAGVQDCAAALGDSPVDGLGRDVGRWPDGGVSASADDRVCHPLRLWIRASDAERLLGVHRWRGRGDHRAASHGCQEFLQVDPQESQLHRRAAVAQDQVGDHGPAAEHGRQRGVWIGCDSQELA